jgi:hypothetical protein
MASQEPENDPEAPEESDTLDFDGELRGYIENGWEIMSDGPSGVQLRAPKTMKGLDKACLVFGILTVIFWGIGLFFIFIAVLDYAFFTERDSVFIPRPQA